MSGRYSFCIAAVIIWLVGAGICAEEAAPKWGEITEEEKALTPPAEYPEAPAVVIFDIAQAAIDDKPYRIVFDRHIRIKVFNKNALGDAAEIEIPYYYKDRIVQVEAQTIAPNGTRTVVQNFYTKKTETVWVLTFAFPAVEDGTILEYRYRRSGKSSLSSWYFQGPLYVMRSKYTIINPYYAGVSVKGRNLNVEAQSLEYDADGIKGWGITYELANLMPIVDEPFVRAKYDNLPSVVCESGFSRLTELGRAWNEWYQGFAKDKKAIAAVADRVCTGLTTNEEKTERLFGFVHDSIKTNVESDEVDDAGTILKHGRCDAWWKNALLTALLGSRDIPAHLLLIGRRDRNGDFNPLHNDPSELDYLLCLAGPDDGGMPLDARAEFVFYPRVPSYCLVNRGLVIDGDSVHTISLREPEWKNGSDVISTVWIQPSGSAVCTTSIRVYGCAIEQYKEFRADTISSDNIVKRFLSNTPAAYTIVSASGACNKETGEFTFDIVLNLPTYGSVIDSNMFVAPFLYPIEENRFSAERRFFPVDFPYPYSVRHRIRIYLPDNRAVADVPVEVRKQIDGAVFSRKILMEGNVVDARADLKIEKTCFTVPEYPGLKALFETMAASGADKIAAAVKAHTE